ncbi:MAG TPA: zf-HC2 domain-containing protein [Pyrinomonadaceae bacterium]
MNCNEAKYVMPLYLSGELDAKSMSDFELHLDQCVLCHREIEEQRAYDNLLRACFVSEQLDVRNLRARVWNRIMTSDRGTLFFRRPARLVAIAAMLLLAVCTGIVYLSVRSKSVATVYADAVDDHYEEVVQRTPLSGWRTDLDMLGQRQLGDSEIINKLGPAGYQLVRARVCELGGELYVHAEYKNEKGEISIFIKRRSGDLPGAAKDVVNGCPIHVETTRGFQVAGFQTEQFTVLIVSDLPSTENFRLARESASRVA